MTLEEAQAEILKLQEEKAALATEKESLSQNNTELAEELATVKRLNQQYFNKLSQQFLPTEDKEEEENEVPSCEEFAKSLNII